ncbi:MAG: S58 family peptidase [Alphaproteobacteria bacterium]|nr:S58 family peptidase [Alphaproteobacteria bacterium]
MAADPRRETPSGKPRARALGVPFDGEPGPNNAITDVAGVEVGYCTLIRGDGPLVVGQGPVRTGVTAILPRGRGAVLDPVFAGTHDLNGWGELTGTHRIEGAGLCGGPITITNSMSVGVVRDAAARWLADNQNPERLMDLMGLSIRVTGETYDGDLNDIVGQHVRPEHVVQAIEGARGGPLELGSVGGGTGMIAYEFKGGCGSASRIVTCDGRAYSVGVFVQANHGLRRDLIVAGIPVGRMLGTDRVRADDMGSIIGVCATDVPLLPQQLKRVAQRVGLGLARTGAIARNGSGEMFLAFSVANPGVLGATEGPRYACFVHDIHLSTLFEGVVSAAEEAVIDAMVANAPMTGRDGRTVPALPHKDLISLLSHHRRLTS